MSIVDTENSTFFGTEFEPFNDTNQPRIEQAIISITLAKQGIDTEIIDSYREGVNIRTNKHRFASTQPKFWSGNLQHFTNTNVIGQARSFVEYDNSSVFVDHPISASNSSHPADFNAIEYISNPNYPKPVRLNSDGRFKEEAFFEPFELNLRKTHTSIVTPNSVKANFENGNYFGNPAIGSSIVEQFVQFSLPLRIKYFLDGGQMYYGPPLIGSIEEINDALKNSIIVEGDVSTIQSKMVPFDETKDESIVDRINTENIDLISVLKQLKFDLDNDIRESFEQKSATAGHDVYGINTGYTGTDSIAYIGTYRGSN